MNKSDFLKYLNNANEDNEDNLYVINDYGQKTYFCTIKTICADLIGEYCCKEEDGYELYDRHFWNDDTLICQIVRKDNPWNWLTLMN